MRLPRLPAGNDMSQKKLHKAIRIIMIAIPIVVFGWLVSKDFVFSGILDVTYNFSKPSPFISQLWPPGRVSEISVVDGDAQQMMKADPVTFHVKLPRRFNDAALEVRYRRVALASPDGSSQSLPFRIGLKIDPDAWKWDIKTPDETIEGEWTIGRVRFTNLADYAGEGSSLEVLLNAPWVNMQFPDPPQTLDITSIRVIAERESVTFANVWGRGMSYVKRNI